MRPNPGGYISPDDVLGRDALIQRLWDVLRRQSLVLSAERRMGKTCVIRKMAAKVIPGTEQIYHDLEKIQTPLEFVETVFGDVEGYLSRLERTTERVRRFMVQIGGGEIGGLIKFPEPVAPHWKTLLTQMMEDLAEHQDRNLIFFWDELPLMLYNIRERAGEAPAMEVLDALRSVRQMCPRLRMVFTGSIGLHNVLSSLRRAGYANDPTNDMHPEEVPPLSSEDAQELAKRLLEGDNIQTEDIGATTQAIASAVDGVPYFIHHVVDQMKLRGGRVDHRTAEEIVSACLVDSRDPWHLTHYRDRINNYYGKDEQPFALNMLDVLCVVDQPLTFDEIFNRLKSQLVTEDVEKAKDVLTLLRKDHYIEQQRDGRYCFRFPLIRRGWRLQRGIAR